MPGRKKENYRVAEIESLIEIVDEILPVTTTEWDTVAERHYTFFPEFSRTGESLKRKFNSIAKRSGPSGDPNCPPYVRKAKAVKKKIIEKTDGSTGSNHGNEGFGSSNESYSNESFENNDDNNDHNNNSTVNDSNIPASVVIKSSSNFAQSEDRSNETQGGKDTTSTAKKGKFIQILLHSLQCHAKSAKSLHLFHTIVMNLVSKILCPL